MSVVWHTFDEAHEAFHVLAAHTSTMLLQAKHDRGGAHLVLSGGRTPVQYLPVLAASLDDWHGISVSLSDERWVPLTHPDSNEDMVREHFLSLAPGAEFAGMMGSGDDVARDAERADGAYRALARPSDVTILGAAPDGHVASLFPGHPSVFGDAQVIATTSTTGEARLSLSAPALLSTRQVFIVTSGQDKRDTLKKAMSAELVSDLPVRLLLAQDRVPVTVLDYD